MVAFRLILLSFLLWTGVALAQTSVKQSGNVTAGHQTVWTGNGLVSDGGAQAINVPLTGGSATSLAASSTTYCSTSGCNASQAEAALSTATGSITNLYFSVGAAPGGGQTATITLLTGSYGLLIPTSVTCSITGSATSCSDTTHIATITAGQSWAIQVVMSSGAVSTSGQSFGVQLTSVYPAPLPSQTVRQSGNVTAGHAVVWTTNGILQDAGFGLLGPLALTFPPNTVFGNPTGSTGSAVATAVPTATTPALGDNSNRLATTEFVTSYFPKVLTGYAGVDPNGNTDSTAGIQTALNSGGVILAPCGTYLISGTVTISNPVTLIGCAWNFSNGASFKGTSFRTSNDGLHLNNDFFHVESDDVHLQNFNCQGLAGRYALSKGVCIALGTDSISHSGFTLTNVSSNSNSQLLNIENANFFKLDGIDTNDYYGITINNANADQGAGSIVNSVFNQSGSGIGIQWFANGDLRVTNSKFLCAAYAIYMDWTVGDSGNFELSNSSFENYNSSAIRFNMQNNSFTGVNITGNRFGGGGGIGCGSGAANAILVDNGTTGTLSNVVFTGNVIDLSGNPANGNLIDLGSIKQFLIRDNLVVGNAAATGARVGIIAQASALNGDVSRNMFFGLATSITPGGTGVTSVAQPVDGGTGLSTFTRSGNTTEFGTVTGSLTSGNLIKSDASGNLQDAGYASAAYSQGAWTPVLRGSGTAGTPTYAANGQVGTYEIIGRQVTVRFTVIITSLGGAGAPVGNMQITGLPVAPGSATNDFGACFISQMTGVTTGAGYTFVTGEVHGGTSNINLLENNTAAGTAVAPVTVSMLVDNTTFSGYCSYHT